MKVLYVILITILLAGCGPSAEQMTATAVVAQAQTQTAAPTSTLTQTPTPTATPTPIPEPDAKAMIAWRELGFSDELIALSPSVLGIEEGANAYSLNSGNGSTLEYAIVGSFVFADNEKLLPR